MSCTCCECLKPCPSISLDRWRSALGYNPYFFWQQAQMQDGNERPIIAIDPMDACTQLVYNSGIYGNGTVGRDDIYDAIIQADKDFHDFAGYWPTPTQSCDEVSLTQYETECSRRRDRRNGLFHLRDGYVKQLGKQMLTYIDTVDMLPVDFIDSNGDTVVDTVKISFPDTGIPVEEFALFFTEEDRDQARVDDMCRHEVRPIRAKTDGTTVTITFPSWVLVPPIAYTGFIEGCFDPDDQSIYASSLLLYRRWVDEEQAVTIYYKDNSPCQCMEPAQCSKADCMKACIVSSQTGLIELLPEKCNCQCFPKCIDRICIHYISGDCNNENLIARLAAANVGKKLCCAEAGDIGYWQEDFVGVSERGYISLLANAQSASPFGTRRGQVEAFQHLRTRRHRGVAWI